MEFNILEDLIQVKLQNFINEYSNISNVFKDTDNRNGLLHPGEYGMYKENICKELLSFVLPSKYNIATGFIYNSNKEITTQCDLLIYNKQNTPFLEEKEINRFFPQEVVYSIGEIKSKLTKKTLKDALLKLSKNKAIRKNFDGIDEFNNSVKINTDNQMYSNIFTFLICDEITDFSDDINTEIEEFYISTGVEKKNRHNIILSLKNGVLLYKASDEIRTILQSNNEINMPIPLFIEKGDKRLESLPKYYNKNTIDNLKLFCISINNYLMNMASYYPEPTIYL